MPNHEYPTTVRLPLDLKRSLDKIAKEESKKHGGPRRTRSWLIVDVLRKYVDFYAGQNPDARVR